jgi:hypothetical protein
MLPSAVTVISRLFADALHAHLPLCVDERSPSLRMRRGHKTSPVVHHMFSGKSVRKPGSPPGDQFYAILHRIRKHRCAHQCQRPNSSELGKLGEPQR